MGSKWGELQELSFVPFGTKQPCLTVELKAYTVLLDLFQAMHNHKKSGTFATQSCVNEAYKKCVDFYSSEESDE